MPQPRGSWSQLCSDARWFNETFKPRAALLRTLLQGISQPLSSSQNCCAEPATPLLNSMLLWARFKYWLQPTQCHTGIMQCTSCHMLPQLRLTLGPMHGLQAAAVNQWQLFYSLSHKCRASWPYKPGTRSCRPLGKGAFLRPKNPILDHFLLCLKYTHLKFGLPLNPGQMDSW